MLVAGIDLGGHTISAAVIDFDDNYRIVARDTTVTPCERTLSATTNAIVSTLKKLSANKSIAHVGIAVPGFINTSRNLVLGMPNFHVDRNIDLIANIKEKLHDQDVEIRIENDANCAALGEGLCGVAKNCKDYVVLTLGSGIGCGIVINGNVLIGAHGMAGEAGHIVVTDEAVRCGCGGIGHWETLASADHAEKEAQIYGLNCDFKMLWEKKDENKKAGIIVSDTLNAIARGIASIIVFTDPETVILNGGMSFANGITAEITALTGKYLPVPYRSMLKIMQSSLGADAAIYGATSLFRKNDRQSFSQVSSVKLGKF
jgi:glucokinase